MLAKRTHDSSSRQIFTRQTSEKLLGKSLRLHYASNCWHRDRENASFFFQPNSSTASVETYEYTHTCTHTRARTHICFHPTVHKNILLRSSHAASALDQYQLYLPGVKQESGQASYHTIKLKEIWHTLHTDVYTYTYAIKCTVNFQPFITITCTLLTIKHTFSTIRMALSTFPKKLECMAILVRI